MAMSAEEKQARADERARVKYKDQQDLKHERMNRAIADAQDARLQHHETMTTMTTTSRPLEERRILLLQAEVYRQEIIEAEAYLTQMMAREQWETAMFAKQHAQKALREATAEQES